MKQDKTVTINKIELKKLVDSIISTALIYDTGDHWWTCPYCRVYGKDSWTNVLHKSYCTVNLARDLIKELDE